MGYILLISGDEPFYFIFIKYMLYCCLDYVLNVFLFFRSYKCFLRLVDVCFLKNYFGIYRENFLVRMNLWIFFFHASFNIIVPTFD